VTRNGFHFATATDSGLQPGVQWLLRRNCSITPKQLGLLYGSLCLLSLGISSYFWQQGATMVLPFALLELLAVGVALLVYARHAVDRERIALSGAQLVVELEKGGRVERCEFNREWVRVEPKDNDHSLIELSGQGRRVQIGRFLRPELRPALAREIRSALRTVERVSVSVQTAQPPVPAAG
jgi:uncharacterized membrane protein